MRTASGAVLYCSCSGIASHREARKTAIGGNLWRGFTVKSFRFRREVWQVLPVVGHGARMGYTVKPNGSSLKINFLAFELKNLLAFYKLVSLSYALR